MRKTLAKGLESASRYMGKKPEKRYDKKAPHMKSEVKTESTCEGKGSGLLLTLVDNYGRPSRGFTLSIVTACYPRS